MGSVEALARLSELAASQWDLVTTGQAEARGVSRVAVYRLNKSAHLIQVRRGVYALPSSRFDALQDLRAAWLATAPTQEAEERILLGDDIVVSHLSAASVHGLGDVMPQKHEFISFARHRSVHPDVRFHRRELKSDETVVVDGLPTTSIERTVGDLAGKLDFDHLATVVHDALSKPGAKKTDIESRLDASASRFGAPNGGALVRECLEATGYPAISALTAESVASAVGLDYLPVDGEEFVVGLFCVKCVAGVVEEFI